MWAGRYVCSRAQKARPSLQLLLKLVTSMFWETDGPKVKSPARKVTKYYITYAGCFVTSTGQDKKTNKQTGIKSQKSPPGPCMPGGVSISRCKEDSFPRVLWDLQWSRLWAQNMNSSTSRFCVFVFVVICRELSPRSARTQCILGLKQSRSLEERLPVGHCLEVAHSP